MVVAHRYPSKEASFRDGCFLTSPFSKSSRSSNGSPKSGHFPNQPSQAGCSTNSHVVGHVVTGEVTFTGRYSLIKDPDQSDNSSETNVSSHQM
jgi:hypothetical protein